MGTVSNLEIATRIDKLIEERFRKGHRSKPSLRYLRAAVHAVRSLPYNLFEYYKSNENTLPDEIVAVVRTH